MGLNPDAKPRKAKAKPSANGHAPEPTEVLAGPQLAKLPSVEDIAHAVTICRRANHIPVRPGRLEAALASPEWSVLALEVEQSVGPLDARRLFPDTWIAKQVEMRGSEVEHLRAAYEIAKARVNECPIEPEPERPAEAEGPQPFDLEIIGVDDFAKADYRVDHLVENIIAEGQPGMFGGKSKSMKTTVATDLIVSATTGTPFLDTFEVPRAIPCLFISGESGGHVARETVARICRARGITSWPEAMRDRFFFGTKLPKLGHDDQVQALTDSIRKYGIKLAVIDPLYLSLIDATAGGRPIEASNLFHMGPLLLRISEACLAVGCTPLLVHHFTKNGQPIGEMPELENLAFAGSAEFCRQWILLNRRTRFVAGTGHHEIYMKAGGSMGHGGEWAIDIDEGEGLDARTGREYRVSVCTADLQATTAASLSLEERKAKAIEEQHAKDAIAASKVEAKAVRALAWLRAHGPETKSAWADGTKLNNANIRMVLRHLLDMKAIVEVQVPVKKGKGEHFEAGYAVSPEPGETPPLGGMS